MWDMAVRDAASAGPAQAAGAPTQKSGGTEAAPPAREAVTDTWTSKEAQESSPTLFEMMAEAREKAEAQRARFKIKKSIRYGDMPMEAYARLARARNRTDVSAAAGFARRRIAQLKTALRQDGDNSDAIKAAISQLQKAVMRAGKKKNELGREELAARRQRRAAEEDRRQEAMRQKQELLRQRALRAIRESGYLNEAAISHRMAAQMDLSRARMEASLPGTPAPAAPLPASPDAAAGQYAAAMAAPAPEAPSFSVEG